VNAIKKTRSALTLQPSTEAGEGALTSLANFVQPVVDGIQAVERSAGDSAFNATSSPAAAAAATAVPTAAMEILGLGLAKGPVNALSKIKRAPVERGIDKALDNSAPATQGLRDEATRLFTEVENMGVSVDNAAFIELASRIEADLAKEGADIRVTPEVSGAIARLRESAEKAASGESVPITELETLRKVFKNAVVQSDNNKTRLALRGVDEIDNFLESADSNQLKVPDGKNPREVSARYKRAREQWGRYRRSEALQDAIEIASLRRSGFENGLRNEFEKIVNSKKRSKGFKDHELAAMRRVVNGTAGANVFRELGKMGLGGGQLGNNWLGAFLSGSAAFSVGGLPASVAVILTGTGFKKLSQRLTKGNADFADQVVRAGTDARDITETYMRFTPKSKRNPEELSLLLMHRDIDLKPLTRFRMESEAAKLALEKRAQFVSALAAGSAGKDQQTIRPAIPIPSQPQLQAR